jgi:hypothetical protein
MLLETARALVEFFLAYPAVGALVRRFGEPTPRTS